LVKIFLSHVQESKRNKEIINTALERIKSPKIAPLDYNDEYSRQWFFTQYRLTKNLRLNKLNISWEQIVTFLRKVSKTSTSVEFVSEISPFFRNTTK